MSPLSGNTPLSLSKGTVIILKAIEPPIYAASSCAPGAQAHAPALEAAAKCKNVKRLKCNQGTVLAIRKPRLLYVRVGEKSKRLATRVKAALKFQLPPRPTRLEPLLLYGFVCAELE